MEGVAMRVCGGVTQHFRTRWPEWALAGFLVGQACVLLSSGQLAANRVYVVLASMVHESTLGAIALSLGLIWIAALVLNGTFVAFRRISPWVRVGVALGAACYWALWSVTLYQARGPVTSVSWVNHAGLSCMAVTCLLMSAREVAVADERAASWKCRSLTKIG